MTAVSIRDMLVSTSLNKQKEFSGHDRLHTVGASEVGQCMRKTFYAKNEVPKDAGHVETRGAMDRGDLIENHYWVPGIRGSLPPGVELLYAGDEQRTLVSGFVSATPDGLLTGVGRDALANHGIEDMGSDELIVEAKSIDPRVDLHEAKQEHTFQTQMQMGLIRFCTNHRPEYALLSYVNASFLDDVKEYPVKFDEAVYEAGKRRAFQIMTAEQDINLPPEGKMAGGKECGYCPWAGQCNGATIESVPRVYAKMDEYPTMLLAQLVADERAAAAEKKEWELRHGTAQQAIKDFLTQYRTNRAANDDWKVSYAVVAGRTTLDKDAMIADGIDVKKYEKVGQSSTRLSVLSSR